MNADEVPYAPPANVLGILQRQRQSGLPEILNIQLLSRLGIPASMEHRSLKALRFLGLIDSEGRKTDQFALLGKAPTDTYPDILGQVIREAYDDIFDVLDLTQATPTQVNDAFRHCEPASQRGRMVSLFSALCKEAGIISSDRTNTRIVVAKRRPVKKKLSPVPSEDFNDPYSQTNALTVIDTSPHEKSDLTSVRRVEHGLLHGLLDQLPPNNTWTKKRRDRWLQALTANIDLLIEVTDIESE